jgi:glutamate N-acetyltransferase / amino-acid N-acetyltransferase
VSGDGDVAFHERPVLPRGFSCMAKHCGIKEGGAPDLALFRSEVPAAAAAVFTRNQVCGAPIVLGRELIRSGRLQAVVVNSRVSNVATGAEGVVHARRMGAAAARELGIAPELVLVSSTGVIGVRLPVEKIEAGLAGAAALLQPDPLVGARGIMTTDTYPKALSLAAGAATLTVVAKGSGMIEPHMATLLAYLFTDAAVPAPVLDAWLREAVDASFNMLSVDGDTSTSDTCAILANGLAGPVAEAPFRRALGAACVRMTELLARDGEGATKLIRARVRGAATAEDARRIAKSLINSPLVKTMAFGADPNAGRLLMAVGKCFDCAVDPGRIAADIGAIAVVRGGARADFDEAAVRAVLAGDPVDLVVELGVGAAAATAYGCDLTHGYIDENAAYYSS